MQQRACKGSLPEAKTASHPDEAGAAAASDTYDEAARSGAHLEPDLEFCDREEAGGRYVRSNPEPTPTIHPWYIKWV